MQNIFKIQGVVFEKSAILAIFDPATPPGGQPEFSPKICSVTMSRISFLKFVQNFKKFQGAVDEKSAVENSDGLTDGSELLGNFF